MVSIFGPLSRQKAALFLNLPLIHLKNTDMRQFGHMVHRSGGQDALVLL